METWIPQHVQDRLGTGVELELAFPVRYPRGPLPFALLLRGCVLALTGDRVVAFSYTRGLGRPDGELWSADRHTGFSATLSSGGRRLRLVTARGEGHDLVTSPRYAAELERFVSALRTP
ncbi:MAG: hypothetical protein LBV60_09320 [Streptomyces sp.]|jgi:hypothetical protein|nr:hypothetical protein [Streptomyces sp.]